MRAESGTILLDRPTADDGSGLGQGDWVTVKGKPWTCDCGASKPYAAEMRYPHRVIVWPSKNDPNLKRVLSETASIEGEPAAVVAYERSMGEAVSYYSLTPS